MSMNSSTAEQILGALIEKHGEIRVGFTELQKRRTVLYDTDTNNAEVVLTLRRAEDDDIEQRREREIL